METEQPTVSRECPEYDGKLVRESASTACDMSTKKNNMRSTIITTDSHPELKWKFLDFHLQELDLWGLSCLPQTVVRDAMELDASEEGISSTLSHSGNEIVTIPSNKVQLKTQTYYCYYYY